MTRYVLLALIFSLCLAWMNGCGAPVICEAGEKKLCKCFEIFGEKVCNADGTSYGPCRCTDEPVKEATIDQADGGQLDASEPTADEPMVVDEPTPEPRPEPVADEPMSVDEPVVETTPEPVDCPQGEFSYKGKCYRNADFCESKLSVAGLPRFTTDDQQAMAQPYEIEFDLISKKPIFCKTKEDYYYLGGAGYGLCDKDKDGWINIEAYRAVTSTDKQTQRNARCKLKKFTHVVYHAEGKKPQIQKLKNEAAMVETFRNDGGEKLIELPVYTTNQAALPKTISKACTVDNDCNGSVCYLGHCVAGRRFDPAEINTLTKGCIAGLDLNDNQLDDANESPSDTPTPAGEFGPLLTAGYFMELHYGYHQAGYTDNGNKIDVYHIFERSRTKTPDQQGLALKCQEDKTAYAPDLWKTCPLKDNQQCADPKDPTKIKSGLSGCWLKDVNRLIPSLFRCTVFENSSNYHFHPDQYGFDKHYNRPLCSFKAKLNDADPTKRDVEFSCSVDDGKRQPKAALREVGWACISFQPYTDPDKYLGSCVDQRAEKICGETKDGEPVNYITLEKNSYGLARAKALCGTSNGQGQCGKATRVCSGGSWFACNKCNHCPQQTAGQKTLCPKGVWPSNSCALELKASTEICDGIDNDCDGSIDETTDTNISYVPYYLDADKDGYGEQNTTVFVCVHASSSGKKFCRRSDNKCSDDDGVIDVSGTKKRFVKATQVFDCDDTKPTINPKVTDDCDGVDSNCNGTVDDGAKDHNTSYYKDDDGDGYGAGASVFTACVHKTNQAKICRPSGCIDLKYSGKDGLTTYYVKARGDGKLDCQDQNKDVNPGQTKFFTKSYKDSNNKDSFDYNCDNKSTKDPSFDGKLCQCATKPSYNEYQRAFCDLDRCDNTRDWQKDDSCQNTLCTYTSTGQTSKCELSKIHTLAVTSDYSRSCKEDCNLTSVTVSVSCSKSKLSGSNASTFEPQAADGSKLISFHGNNFKSKSACLFNLQGLAPDCGVAVQEILLSAKQTTPSFSVKKKQLCKSGKTECNFYDWYGYCWYDHTVNYNSTYYYFRLSDVNSAQSTIGCR